MASKKRLYQESESLEIDLENLSGPNDEGLDSFRYRVNTVIADVVGRRSPLSIKFNGLRWKSDAQQPLGDLVDRQFGSQSPVFIKAKTATIEILKTLRWELDRQADQALKEMRSVALDATSIESDLWQHISSLCDHGEWEKVPREAAVFVENSLRQWAKLPDSVTGSVKVFQEALQRFPLGAGNSQTEGWNLLAKGFALAIRNSGGHRLHDREDMQRYAVGVVGIASLLLTEIRNTYGDPPKSPVENQS